MIPRFCRPLVLISVAVPVLVLTSCSLVGVDEFPDTVRLSVEDDRYEPGDSVTLTLENGSDHGIGYNLCTSTLQRRQEDTWTAVDGQREVCTMELRILPPGERATYETNIPSKLRDGSPLPAGRYRYVTNIENMDSNTRTSISTAAWKVD